MNASEITHSDTSWEDDKTATIGETEEMIPNKSASQEQPCDNLPDRTKAQINAVKQVFRKVSVITRCFMQMTDDCRLCVYKKYVTFICINFKND